MLRSRHSKFGWRWTSVILGALLLLPTTGAGARVIERDRYSGTDSGTETICGHRVHFEVTFSGVFMLKTRGDRPTPYFFDNYRFRDVHTQPDGDGFIIQGNGLFKDVKITHVRGATYRIVAMDVGQPFSLRALDGTPLLRDRGMVRFSFLVDTKGDSNLDNDRFIEVQQLKVAGPHPGLDHEAFCDAVNEAMRL